MKNEKNIQIIDNTDKNRFEFELADEKIGIVKYEKLGGKMELTHTQVPAEIRDQGYGTIMMEKIMREIEDSIYKVIPKCPFISAYLEEHPEWNHLVYSPGGQYVGAVKYDYKKVK